MRTQSHLKLALSAMAIIAGASLGAGAAHATSLYSTGFEGPTFTPGPIAGQGGWAVFSASGQPSLAQVETAVVASGSQAVGVDGSAGKQTGPYYALTIASPGTIDMSGDILLTAGHSWQFAATGPGLSQFIGGIDIFGNNIKAISGAFPIIGTFTDNVFHHVDVIMNFASQTSTIKVDGVTLASNLAFCGANAGCNGAHIASFGDGLFDTFGGGTDFGYVDNFSIATVPAGVPEPAAWTVMLIGLAGVGAAMRGRARKTRVAAI